MQEAPASHEAFARILAIHDVIDGGQVGFTVPFAALGRDILPRGILRVLDPLRRGRMRRQEVLRARINRGLPRLEFRVALHRSKKAGSAVWIEMGARRDADADTVGLELLRA
jgi:hypothetical protein